MAYFIFLKNLDNVSGTICKIAENQSDLNNLNITQSDYKIIENSESNFNLVKLGNKHIDKYNNNDIIYSDQSNSFENKNNLQCHVDNLKKQIKEFTDSNKNHPLYDRWNNYYNQLKDLNLDSITYPFNTSLEQYFNDLGQPSLNILHLP
jgi:hypothetical protein